jgi:hypothetical protein
MALLVAQMIHCTVENNPVHPGCEAGLSFERGQCAKQSYKNVLSHIHGVVGVTRHLIGYRVYLVPMKKNELFEGGGVALLGIGHKTQHGLFAGIS